jgi:hypothetical protein
LRNRILIDRRRGAVMICLGVATAGWGESDVPPIRLAKITGLGRMDEY